MEFEQVLPKVIWEQPRRKVPTGYNRTPQIHPQNCPFPFDDHHLHLIHLYLDGLHVPSQTDPDPLSRFATIHFADRPTDRQTDRWSRRQARTMSAPFAMLIESNALKIHHLMTNDADVKRTWMRRQVQMSSDGALLPSSSVLSFSVDVIRCGL